MSKVDHEVRLRIQEQLLTDIRDQLSEIDERFERLNDKIDAQFKWFVGGSLSILGTIGLHLSGYV